MLRISVGKEALTLGLPPHSPNGASSKLRPETFGRSRPADHAECTQEIRAGTAMRLPSFVTLVESF